MAIVKKFLIASIITLSMTAAVLSVIPVTAQTQTMTEAHIARIKTNCGVALATLGRIHANDAPVYINRNQTYYSISDKMMARLNSRLTLNRYDATDLVKIASDFNAALDDFRLSYKAYDNTMADLVRMDCTRAPVSFYDKVGDARDKRERVHLIVADMQKLIDGYRDAVKKFKSDNLDDDKDESDG